MNRIIMVLVFLFVMALNCYAQTAEEYLSLGKSSFKQAKYTQAMSELNKAIKINSKSAEAYFYRSLVYSAQNNIIQAISDCYKSLEIDHNYIDALKFLAYIHLGLKNTTRLGKMCIKWKN